MGAKWETEWQGYKVHLTETVDPDGPQLITDVQSDVAPATDREVLTEIQERLQKRQSPPDQQLVDSGYMTAGNLVGSKRQYGIDLVGPIVEDFSWQAKAGKGFATSDFRIDWENKRAVCPQGKLSRNWQVARGDYGMEIIHIQFLKQDCSVCPTRSDYTKAKSQRRAVTVNVRLYH